MKDPIVERIVQPVVHRLGIDPHELSGDCATLYAALAMTDASMTLSRGESPIGPLLFVCISMLVTNSLWRHRSAAGAAGPIAMMHFIARSIMLAIGLASASQTIIAFVMFGSALAGRHHDPRHLYGDLCSFAEPLLIAFSMYFSACDRPPPGRRRSLRRSTARV